MTTQMQLVMNHGLIDEGASHAGSEAGNMETFRADIKSECQRVLANFGGGAGSEQHNAVMREVDRLIDEHVNALNSNKTGLGNASGTAVATGRRISANMGQTAL